MATSIFSRVSEGISQINDSRPPFRYSGTLCQGDTTVPAKGTLQLAWAVLAVNAYGAPGRHLTAAETSVSPTHGVVKKDAPLQRAGLALGPGKQHYMQKSGEQDAGRLPGAQARGHVNKHRR